MTDTPKASVDQISSFIEKNGISTLLLVAGIYFAYTAFFKPASEKYVAMLDAVTESNVSLTDTIAQLKDGMVQIGQANTEIGNKNSESLADIEHHLRELETISRDIQQRLTELRPPRYIPPTATGDETE